MSNRGAGEPPCPAERLFTCVILTSEHLFTSERPFTKNLYDGKRS